jgi:hypothetical protein
LGDVVRPFLTIEMDYPDGMVRASTLQETVVIDGLTYYGMGVVGSLSPLQEGSENRSYGVTASLTGVPGNFFAYLKSQDVQGRAATIKVGFMNHAFEIVGALVTIFVGRMDTQDFSAGKETSVEVAIESLLIDWERARVRRYTDVDQQAVYPGDRGFEFVSALQNMDLVWGR